MNLTHKILYVVFILCSENLFAEIYQYDNLNRLIHVKYDSGQAISYQYDNAGNITASTINASNSITIQTPNGNEKWQTGFSQILRWSSSLDSTQTVKIALYRGLTQAKLITSSTANTGRYTWAIPSNLTAHNDYRIKITSNSDNTINDSSDANFEIIKNTTVLLSSIRINGASSLNENSAATYTATAFYTNDTKKTITNVNWSENSRYASINSSGVLKTTAVNSNATVTLSIRYSEGRVTKTATKPVLIKNIATTNPNTDSDGDGISDIDEKKYGLNPNDPSDAGADKDSDGFSNIEEIEAGSNIDDSSSLPKRLSKVTAIKISERLNTKGYVSLVVESNLAYLLAEDKLEIVDISNNTNIRLLSTLNLNDSAKKIVKSGNYVYIAHGTYGLRIVDVAKSNSPQLVGTFYTGKAGQVEDVAIQGNYAYVAYNGGGGLNVVNIRNKAKPILEGKYAKGGFNIVKAKGNYIYIDNFSGKHGLSIVKFNPLAALNDRVTLVGKHEEASLSHDVRDVAIKGNIAYLLINDIGVRILDISDSKKPKLISTIGIDDNNNNINALAQYVFVNSSNHLGLQVFYVGNKKASKLLDRFNLYKDSRQSIFTNNHLYVVDRDGVKIFTVSPTLLSSNANGVAIIPIINMLLSDTKPKSKFALEQE